MMSLVRQLVTFLRRWLNKWDKLAEHKQLGPPSFYELIDGKFIFQKPNIGQSPPRRNHWGSLVQTFGDPDWRHIKDSAHLRAGPDTKAWKRKHMVLLENLPGHDIWPAKGLKKLYVNKAIAQPLTTALSWLVQLYHDGHLPGFVLRVLECFNPRRIGYQTFGNWSIHAYGGAVDINPDTNARGTVGELPQLVVEVFRACYFYWGGDYKKSPRDDMHMEYVV